MAIVKKGAQIARGTMRDRATIRGREVADLSDECFSRTCGDCQDPDCTCGCHNDQDEGEIEDESP
jgi:hypothetical protein